MSTRRPHVCLYRELINTTIEAFFGEIVPCILIYGKHVSPLPLNSLNILCRLTVSKLCFAKFLFSTQNNTNR